MTKFDGLSSSASEKPNYNFLATDVELIPRGIEITWSAKGLGFGGMLLLWHPDGKFVPDSEHMDAEFIEALLVETAPKLAALIVSNNP